MEGVKYLLVGASAVIYYAEPRFTKDMTAAEQINYFRVRSANGPLGEWWQPVKKGSLSSCRRRGAILLSCSSAEVALALFRWSMALRRIVGYQPPKEGSHRSHGLGYDPSPDHSHVLPCLRSPVIRLDNPPQSPKRRA